MERSSGGPSHTAGEGATAPGSIPESASAGLTDQRQLAVFSSVVTALGRDPEFADGFRNQFIGPKVERTRELYARAAQRGELREGIDLDVVGPALSGIVLHSQFILGRQPTPESITAVIDQVILPAVLAPTPSSQEVLS